MDYLDASEKMNESQTSGYKREHIELMCQWIVRLFGDQFTIEDLKDVDKGLDAAEIIMERVDAQKANMGLTSFKGAKVRKADVTIAKNYLAKEEITELNEIVTMYLDYATRQARRHIPMTMEDWKTKLDAFLRFNDADVLQDKGKVTAAIAKEFAESEFEKYRVIQDSLYQSDFDRLLNSVDDEI